MWTSTRPAWRYAPSLRVNAGESVGAEGGTEARIQVGSLMLCPPILTASHQLQVPGLSFLRNEVFCPRCQSWGLGMGLMSGVRSGCQDVLSGLFDGKK